MLTRSYGSFRRQADIVMISIQAHYSSIRDVLVLQCSLISLAFRPLLLLHFLRKCLHISKQLLQSHMTIFFLLGVTNKYLLPSNDLAMQFIFSSFSFLRP